MDCLLEPIDEAVAGDGRNHSEYTFPTALNTAFYSEESGNKALMCFRLLCVAYHGFWWLLDQAAPSDSRLFYLHSQCEQYLS